MVSIGQDWDWLEGELAALRRQGQYRELRKAVPHKRTGEWIELDGRKVLNLASNNYLGLSGEAGLSSLPSQTRDLGGGAAASRLIVGNHPVYDQFEEEFARYKGKESVLLFSSGYMANIGIISSLIGRNDLIFSDRLNHASIVDGIVLSRAEFVRYRHNDLDHLEHLLRQAAGKPGRRKWIITDSVFSMDGDTAPLTGLAALKERYGAYLMVDEAHSGGVYGAEGQGLVHSLGLTDRVDLIMGTFSKAYGVYGAYLAADRIVKQYVLNKARSFIYTTALPPLVIGLIDYSWQKLKAESWRRFELERKANLFREKLKSAGLDTMGSTTQIIPVRIGDNEAAVKFSARVQESGIAAVAIRPPTVPENTARIRFSLMATHSDADLLWAAERIIQTGQEMGLIK